MFSERARQLIESKKVRAAQPPASVQGYVRRHLDEILAAREEGLSWPDVAAVLAAEGVAWKTGRPVAPDALSTIVSRLRRQRRPARFVETPRPRSVPSERRVSREAPVDAPRRRADDLPLTCEEVDNVSPSSRRAMEEVPAPKRTRIDEAGRAAVRAEMRRAAAERGLSGK